MGENDNTDAIQTHGSVFFIVFQLEVQLDAPDGHLDDEEQLPQPDAPRRTYERCVSKCYAITVCLRTQGYRTVYQAVT